MVSVSSIDQLTLLDLYKPVIVHHSPSIEELSEAFWDKMKFDAQVNHLCTPFLALVCPKNETQNADKIEEQKILENKPKITQQKNMKENKMNLEFSN